MDLSQLMELAQLFSSGFNSNMDCSSETEEGIQENQEEEEKYLPLVFDEQLQTQNMKIVKAVIPYMSLEHQKLLGVFIKFMEIQRLLERREEVAVAAVSPQKQQEDMLKAMKPYCSKQNQQNINMIIRMFEMKEILKQVEDLKELMG